MDTGKSQSVFATASGLRRLAAFGIDYALVILPYVILLGLAGWALITLEVTPFDPGRPWLNQGIVILLLTLPIGAYFAVCEASTWKGTVGKRLMRVAVANNSGERVSLKQSFVRVAIKFLPWEYFQTLLWQWEGWPMHPSPPTALQIAAMSVGWLVMGWFVASLFVGSRTTPYDWVAGTVVATVGVKEP